MVSFFMSLHYRRDVRAAVPKTSDQACSYVPLTSQGVELTPQCFLEMGTK